MDRYVVNTAATLEVTFSNGDTPVSAGTVTVTIVRADGTSVALNAATTTGGTGVYRYTIPAATNTLIDILTAQWTGTVGGQTQSLTTTTEIVGGHHFSLAQLRALAPLENTTTYPTADLVTARTAAESTLEHECGVAFVPRYWKGRVQRLGRYPVSDVRVLRYAASASTLDNTVLTASELDTALTSPYPYWYRRRGPWIVGLEYGMDYPPADVARASMLLARHALVSAANTASGSLDERATTVTYADAGLTYSLVTAAVQGAVTGIPEVNSVISRYGAPAVA